MSDTKFELRRDQWKQNHFEMCGTCYHMTRIKGKKYCGNEESEAYGEEIDYSDGCDNYTEG